MERKLGRDGGTIGEQCQSDPSEGRDGWGEVFQSAAQGKGGLARLLGGPQTKVATCVLRDLSGRGQAGPGIGDTATGLRRWVGGGMACA